MRRLRLLGFFTSLVTAGIVVGAPALAAGGTQVPLSFNSAVLLAAGATASQSASHNACKTKGGATFGDAHAVNSAGWTPGSFTPAASPVAFTLGPATGKDAVCVSQSQSATIQVPAGKYTDAYFLVGVANGPALASITPNYSGGAGAPISIVFDDWCTMTSVVKGTLTLGTTAGFVATGGRVASKDGKAQKGLPCTLYNTHVSGLDGSKTLTSLTVALAAKGTAIPTQTGIKAGTTQGGNPVANIAAVTLATSTSSGPSAALPKTGAGESATLTGFGLLLAGAALLLPRRRLRSAK